MVAESGNEESPDWNRLRELSGAFLERCKHFDAAVHFALASTRTSGFVGLADGLGLLSGMAEEHWDVAYPSLDPSDSEPAYARAALFEALNSTEPPLRFLHAVWEAPLLTTRGYPRVSTRDILLTEGSISPRPGEAVHDERLIQAAANDADPEETRKTSTEISTALETINRLEAVFVDRIRSDPPSLEALREAVERAEKALVALVGGQGAGVNGAPESPSEEARSGDNALATERTATPPGAIRSDEDVLRAIDRICEYYREHEKSSPVPLLLGRARKLVGKGYLDIVDDLLPDGVRDMKRLGGINDGG